METYYRRDRLVPFPWEVELTVAVPMTPDDASSLLEGFVSLLAPPPPLLSGGSFRFSKTTYSTFTFVELLNFDDKQ